MDKKLISMALMAALTVSTRQSSAADKIEEDLLDKQEDMEAPSLSNHAEQRVQHKQFSMKAYNIREAPKNQKRFKPRGRR